MNNKIFIFLQHIAPQHLISAIAGFVAECKIGFIKNIIIKLFITHYGVDMQEAKEPDYHQYENFNAFFTRALKDGTREIAEGSCITSPADGVISQLGKINQDQIFQAKRHSYSDTELLGGKQQTADTFNNGSFATIYLSPKDYHRVHMPITGTLLSSVYIPGDLFSVNNATAENVPRLFARNERLVTIFDTEIGKVAIVLVGAIIVAGIETVWGESFDSSTKLITKPYDSIKTPIKLNKGEEMGRFKLGSTVILLFENNRIDFNKALTAQSSIRMGGNIENIILQNYRLAP